METFEETELVELKKSTSELKEAIISIASILNKSHKGELYFGIKNDGTVVGQQVTDKTLRQISQRIANSIEPRILPEIKKVKIQKKDCIKIKFTGNKNELYYAYGRAYIRISDEDKRLSPQQIENRVRNKVKNEYSQIIWDKQKSKITDKQIKVTEVKSFFIKAKSANRINFNFVDVKTSLKKLGLIESNKIVNAAEILFGKTSPVELQLAVFASNERITFLDIDQDKNNIFSLLEKAESYLKSHIKWRVKFGKMEREEIPEIPVTAIREALVNSFCHRDYTRPEGNQIAIFKNRIEIYNPGSFPKDVKPEDFIKNEERSILRNPTIADILYKSKDIEKWGSGLKRIYTECKAENIKVEFKTLKTGFMTVFYRPTNKQLSESLQEKPAGSKKSKLPEKVTGKGYRKKSAKLPKTSQRLPKEFSVISDEVQSKCSRNAVEILNTMSKNKYITVKEISDKINLAERTIYNNIKQLKKKNILKRVGPDKGGYWEIITK